MVFCILLVLAYISFSNCSRDWYSVICDGRNKNNSTQPLRYCNNSEIVDGSWKLFSSIEQPSYRHCPRLYESLTGTLKSHAELYSSNTFYKACFQISSDCDIYNNRNTFDILKNFLHGKELRIVGDSVSGQLYTAIVCRIESTYGYNAINVRVLVDMTLAKHVLCSKQCDDVDFFESAKKSSPNPCTECDENGNKVPLALSPWILDTDSIVKNVGILVINTGRWYSLSRGVDNPEAAVRETLELILPKLKTLYEYGVIIVWDTIPPLEEFAVQSEIVNKVAYEVLQDFCIFLDVGRTVQDRVRHDKNVTVHGHIHFSNPSHSSIPNFMSVILFHLLAEKIAASP